MRIYGDMRSGNCYKIKLVAALLDIEYEWLHVDVMKGETKTPVFLEKNPNAKIPMIELEDGRCLSESNAIVNYLAAGSELLSEDAFTYAKIQQWQFFEQYSHEPFIAVARFIAKYLQLPDDRKSEYESKHAGGYKALGVMEKQLKQTAYLVGHQMTTADICLYAYTQVADEGGFDLSTYPAVMAWLARIQSHPKYVGME